MTRCRKHDWRTEWVSFDQIDYRSVVRVTCARCGKVDKRTQPTWKEQAAEKDRRTCEQCREVHDTRCVDECLRRLRSRIEALEARLDQARF